MGIMFGKYSWGYWHKRPYKLAGEMVGVCPVLRRTAADDIDGETIDHLTGKRC